MKKLFIVSILLGFLVSSCATKKEIIYFQDANQLDGTAIGRAYEPLVEPNDILNITLSSIEDELLIPYRRNATGEPIPAGNIALRGYLVNVDGYINYPGLGDLKVSGKTRLEIVSLIKEKLTEFITADVVVDVRIVNYKVTVLGAVLNPGVFTVNNESVTLPEAIALAGDLTENGSRDELTIIREIDGKRQIKKIDLTSTDFFLSDYYFLKQNDIVYVEPSLKGVKRSGFIPDIPSLIALGSVILSTVILLTR